MTGISKKRLRALTETDQMPRPLRECVNEFGYAIVSCCLISGITSPSVIRKIVPEIWAGAREQSQRHGAIGTLDWLLVQAGAGISAATLRRLLAQNNMLIVSAEPTAAMTTASMSTVAGGVYGKISKQEKHRLRLQAALRAELIKQVGVVA